MDPSSKMRHPHALLATDLSPASRPHVEFALRLADRLGARTTLFHAAPAQAVVVEPLLVVMPVPPREDLVVSRQQLQAVAAACHTKLPVHVAVEAVADAREAILAAAARVSADLLILPTHGRTGVKRALLGSTAEHVLRRSTHPVMLITDKMLQAESRAAPGEQPVLLCTDLSPTAAHAHGAAADLARRLGRSLLLVSVLPVREPPPFGGGLPVKATPTPPEERIRERVKQLRELAVSLGEGLQVEVLAHLHDEPAAAIVELARTRDAAFLVLATHARKGLARALHGSVAESVVRHATVPVLCVPVHSD